MDQTNPAVSKQLAMPPALLEEFASNPKAFKDYNLKLLAVHVDVMHMRMRDPTVPMSVRLQFMELLAKLGDAIPKQANVSANAGVPTFSVNINMTQRKADQNVIEGAVTEVRTDATATTSAPAEQPT